MRAMQLVGGVVSVEQAQMNFYQGCASEKRHSLRKEADLLWLERHDDFAKDGGLVIAAPTVLDARRANGEYHLHQNVLEQGIQLVGERRLDSTVWSPQRITRPKPQYAWSDALGVVRRGEDGYRWFCCESHRARQR